MLVAVLAEGFLGMNFLAGGFFAGVFLMAFLVVFLVVAIFFGAAFLRVVFSGSGVTSSIPGMNLAFGAKGLANAFGTFVEARFGFSGRFGRGYSGRVAISSSE